MGEQSEHNEIKKKNIFFFLFQLHSTVDTQPKTKGIQQQQKKRKRDKSTRKTTRSSVAAECWIRNEKKNCFVRSQCSDAFSCVDSHFHIDFVFFFFVKKEVKQWESTRNSFHELNVCNLRINNENPNESGKEKEKKHIYFDCERA